MIVIKLCFLAFEVSIVGKLSKVKILPGETLFIGEALVKLLNLVDLVDLLAEFAEGLFHLIFLLDKFHEGFFAH